MSNIQNCVKDLDVICYRHFLHVVLGLTCLLYPFLHLSILVLIMVFLLIILKIISSGILNHKFFFKSQECKTHLEKSFHKQLKSTNYLVLSILFLLILHYAFSLKEVVFPLYVIGGSISISTFATSYAIFFKHSKEKQLKKLDKINYPQKNYKKEKKDIFYLLSTFFMLLVGIFSAFFTCVWIIYWNKDPVSIDMVLFIAVIGSVTGALFNSIPSRVDSNISILFSSCMVMWLFASFGYTVPAAQMSFAFVFSFFLGYLAYKAQIADISASLSACLLGILIIVFSDFVWFLILLAFFILGGAVTKYKYAYKESIGIAESKGGVRSYENVFSNSMTALILAIAYGMHPQYSDIITYAYLGTVATATGDTLASEIGTTSKKQPRMITTLKVTKPGIDGSVTILGEMASLFGSFIIGLLAVISGMVSDNYMSIFLICIGGFIGTNIDSILGATLQNRGLLTNSGVNFFATLAGAIVSAFLYLFIFH